MRGLIDYAGLFPPASLPLEAALASYVRYRSLPDAWMLARFVIPASRLVECDTHEALLSAGAPHAFSVLPTGAASAPAFLDALDDDIAAIARFLAHHQGRMSVPLLECRLPADLFDARADTLSAFLSDVRSRLTFALPEPLTLFVEESLTPHEADRTERLAGVLGQLNAAAGGEAAFGYKMRTGGLTPADVPSVEAIAQAIVCCRESSVPFKATAGLHHPIRQFRSEIGGVMHGFANVFVAGILAEVQALDTAAVQTILADEDADNFVFSAVGLGWKNLAATEAQIADARAHFATSFGSCSFEEPLDDLRALGLLDAP